MMRLFLTFCVLAVMAVAPAGAQNTYVKGFGETVRLTTQKQKTNVTCKSEEHTEEMEFIETCLYKNRTLMQAYALYLSDFDVEDKSDFIKDIKPGENKQKENPAHAMSVKYTWKSEENLVIEQNFAGGETLIFFSVQGKDTLVTTKSYPD